MKHELSSRSRVVAYRKQHLIRLNRRRSRYNECRRMARKTVHVYPEDGAWAVNRDGACAETFATQREAVKAARDAARRAGGQLVIHGQDGRITEHETYGMTVIQDPPKKSRLARTIGRAVGKIALERIQGGPVASRAGTRQK